MKYAGKDKVFRYKKGSPTSGLKLNQGKGDEVRPHDPKKYRDNYDQIDWSSKKKKDDKKTKG